MSSDLLLLGIANPTVTYGWGVSRAGELDNNEKFYNFVESPTVLGDKSFSTVVGSGIGAVYGLDGTDLWLWGSVAYVSALFPSYNKSSPVQIGGAWSKVAGSILGSHVLAIKTDGTLWSWGTNTYGQLGNGTVVSSSSPVQIGALTTWTDIAVGSNFSLALRSDNTVWAFGRNDRYQLGQNSTSTANASSPVQVSGGTGFTKIFAASTTGLGIKSDGTLWGWGANNSSGTPVVNFYILAGATTANSQSAPIQIGSDTTWTKLAPGESSVFGFKTDAVWVWGYNGNGILGIGTTDTQSSPVQLAGSWDRINCTGYTTYGIKSDGSLWSWGTGDGVCQLGVNIKSSTSPILVDNSKTWTDVTSSGSAVLAPTATALTDEVGNNVYAWGAVTTSANYLVNPTYYTIYNSKFTTRSSPVQYVSQTNKFKQIALGYSDPFTYSDPTFSSGITFGKNLYTWGVNNYGQLGDGTTQSRSSPVLVSSNQYEYLALGNDRMYAIKADGTLWAWGYNYSGALGDGTSSTSRSSPVQCGALSNFTSVATGFYGTLATTDTNYVYAMGLNDQGIFGNGASIAATYSTPTLVGTDVTKVFIRDRTSFFIKTNGSLWSSGLNAVSGAGKMLGWSSASYATTAGQVVGTYSYPWVKVAPGYSHVIGLTSDGSLWGWGTNSSGQLGTAVAVGGGVSTPVLITTGVTDIEAGSSVSYFVKNGALYGLGTNTYGQLGVNTLGGSYSSPVLIGSASGWRSISTSFGGDRALGVAAG